MTIQTQGLTGPAYYFDVGDGRWRRVPLPSSKGGVKRLLAILGSVLAGFALIFVLGYALAPLVVDQARTPVARTTDGGSP